MKLWVWLQCRSHYIVGLSVGGQISGHTLVLTPNHCSPTHTKMESSGFKTIWNLKMVLSVKTKLQASDLVFTKQCVTSRWLSLSLCAVSGQNFYCFYFRCPIWIQSVARFGSASCEYWVTSSFFKQEADILSEDKDFSLCWWWINCRSYWLHNRCNWGIKLPNHSLQPPSTSTSGGETSGQV